MAKKVKSDKELVIVTWPGGSREYSRTDHGDDFETLAQQFADKVGGIVA